MYKINEGYFNTFTLVLFKIFQKIFIFNNFMRKKNKAFLRNLVVRQNKKKTKLATPKRVKKINPTFLATYAIIVF